MVFIHVYHSKAWLVDDYRDPALETNITTTVTGAATRDPFFEPDPKITQVRLFRLILQQFFETTATTDEQIDPLTNWLGAWSCRWSEMKK